MNHYPIFYQHPKTGQDCLIVIGAESREDRDLRALAISRTWTALGLKWGRNIVFVYRYDGRLCAGEVLADSLTDAEAHLASFSRMMAETL
jgi:hypothetical protein